MNLRCRIELADAYRAAPQIARVLSEDWCSRELYCPACDSDCILKSKTNTPAIDFTCPKCEQTFQLKSLRKWNPKKVVDAGYDAMIRAIRADSAPHLLLLQCTSDWCVSNLVLVPRMFLVESAVEKRRPLRSTARRAGWIGCNILLSSIPEDGKIGMVSSGIPEPEQKVRQESERVRGLAKLPPSLRGWTVDVLNVVWRLGKTQFSLQELYQRERELQAAHPRNANVHPKIRQQLQVLRDLGLIEFTGRGNYKLRG